MIQPDKFRYYDDVSTRYLLLEPFTLLRVILLVKQDDYCRMISLWLSNEWIYYNYPNFFHFLNVIKGE